MGTKTSNDVLLSRKTITIIIRVMNLLPLIPANKGAISGKRKNKKTNLRHLKGA